MTGATRPALPALLAIVLGKYMQTVYTSFYLDSVFQSKVWEYVQ